MTPERKQAEEILLEVFEMGMDAQEIGMTSFDMIKQTGRIDKMINKLASLKLAEATKEMYPLDFVVWKDRKELRYSSMSGRYYSDTDMGVREFTLNELFEYWKQNIRKNE